MPKKKTYKDLQAEARAALKPRLIPLGELLDLANDPDKPKFYNPGYGANRKRRRSIAATKERSFTRSTGEKATHIVMDHTLEREKLDPKFTNHEQMKYRSAYRNAVKEHQREQARQEKEKANA